MELINTSLISDGQLRGYYRFNTGASTTDSSSAGRTLTGATPTTSTTSPKYGSYATSKGWRDADNYGVSSPSNALSIVGWVKRTAADSGSNGVFAEHSATATQCRYSSTQLVFALGGVERITYNHSLSIDVWYHLAYVSSGSATRLYVNGVSVATGAAGGSTGTNRGLSLGQEFDDQDPFRGVFDEVAFFSKELSASEVGLLASDFGAVLLNML